MQPEDARKYLQICGRRLLDQHITGEILLSSGVVLLLDIKKPQIHTDIDAYLQGDDAALIIPKDIASYLAAVGLLYGLRSLKSPSRSIYLLIG
jgi:hypothetical protein